MDSRFAKKLDQSNQQIQQLKSKVSVAQSKVLSRAQKKPQTKKVPDQQQFTTPIKKQSTTNSNTNADTIDSNTANSASNNKTGNPGTDLKNTIGPAANKTGGDFILDDTSLNPSKPSAINSGSKPKMEQNPLGPNTNNTSTTISKVEPKGSTSNPNQPQQKSAQQLQKQKQERERKQKQLESQLQKQKQEEQERIRQFQKFLTTTHNLRDLLEEKAKFIEIEFEKQKIYWQEERTKYQKEIDALHYKLEEKNKKIQEMIQKIAELKQFLKAKTEECEEKTKIIEAYKKQTEELKQQNTKVKLENKNLKADNKVVISHLDKLMNEQRRNEQKTAREIFEEREKRVLDALYTRTMSPVKTQTSNSFLPSDRDELSNKLKLQRTLQEYENHRQQSNRKIWQLQKTISARESQIQNLKKRIHVLQQNVGKLNQLRDLQRDSHKKQHTVIMQYERNFKQITQHNECLSEELEKYYKLPRFKQKIGCISRSRRIRQTQTS